MTIITVRTMFNCITKLFVDASKGYQLDDKIVERRIILTGFRR